MERSIHIILSEIEENFKGEEIRTIDDEQLKSIYSLVKEAERLNKNMEKLDSKRQKALRHANKFMRQIIDSHGIKYDSITQAVGVSEQDVIYIGEKERIVNNPNGDPIDSDSICGKITKYERRKYDEMLDGFKYLNQKTIEHNKEVSINESLLINFEKRMLVNKEYSREGNYLVVFSKSKRVVLCKKETK